MKAGSRFGAFVGMFAIPADRMRRQVGTGDHAREERLASKKQSK